MIIGDRALEHIQFKSRPNSAARGVAAVEFVEWSDAACGALVGPVARIAMGNREWGVANVGYAAVTGAARDVGLVAWLSSRLRERTWGDEGSASGVCVDNETEFSLVPEDSYAVFAGLDRTLP
jgi:hypothetical protein